MLGTNQQTNEFNPHAGFECVTWLDSFGLEGGWQHAENVELRPVTIASAGLVLAEDDQSLTLAAHVGYHGSERAQVGGALTIPKVAIVQRARITSSCFAPASEQTRQPTSLPSSTSDLEGSETPSSQPAATCVRSAEVSS